MGGGGGAGRSLEEGGKSRPNDHPRYDQVAEKVRGETNCYRDWRRNLSQRTSADKLKQLRDLKLMTMRKLPVGNPDSSSSDYFQNVFGGGYPSFSIVQDGSAVSMH
jgi:hypothetical protein